MGLKSTVATFIQTNDNQKFKEKAFDLLANIYQGLKYNDDESLPWDFMFLDKHDNIDFAWVCIGDKYIANFDYEYLQETIKVIEGTEQVGKVNYEINILIYTSLKNEDYKQILKNTIGEIKNKYKTKIEVFDIYSLLEEFTNAIEIELSDKITALNQKYKIDYQKIMEQKFYIEEIPHKIGAEGLIKTNNIRKTITNDIIVKNTEGAEFFQRVLSKKIFEINQNWLFVISEFGFGKTSLLLNLSEYLIGKNLSTFYIPFARLSNDAFGDESSLCRKLLNTLYERDINSNNIFDRISISVLKKMLKNRQDIVLLFDGLDEFSKAYNETGLKRIFDVLRDFSSAIVFTVRKEFWDDKQGILQQNIRKKNLTLFLTDWTNKEIQEFSYKYLANINNKNSRDNIIDFIKSLNKDAYSKFYGDIPKRPLFLEMILKDVQLEKVNKRHLHELYERYLIDKYKRDRYSWISDADNYRPLNLENKDEDLLLTIKKIFTLLELLTSKMMFNEGDWSITYITTISENEVVNTAKEVGIDNLNIIDILVNSVLISYDKRSIGDFKLRFAHKSFQEYFVARYLISLLKSTQNEPRNLDWFNYNFSKGVDDFVFGMIDKIKRTDKIEFENCLYNLHNNNFTDIIKSIGLKISIKYPKPKNFNSICNRIVHQNKFKSMEEKSKFNISFGGKVEGIIIGDNAQQVNVSKPDDLMQEVKSLLNKSTVLSPSEKEVIDAEIEEIKQLPEPEKKGRITTFLEKNGSWIGEFTGSVLKQILTS